LSRLKKIIIPVTLIVIATVALGTMLGYTAFVLYHTALLLLPLLWHVIKLLALLIGIGVTYTGIRLGIMEVQSILSGKP
tara:strand:+ start:426 stop:662 length:237 start_codon:yes stop_codon:yes gene_type:complete